MNIYKLNTNCISIIRVVGDVSDWENKIDGDVEWRKSLSPGDNNSNADERCVPYRPRLLGVRNYEYHNYHINFVWAFYNLVIHM